MIRQEAVLTATSLALEKIPQDFKMIDRVGDLVQGLSASTMTLDGYTLDNLAVDLPKNTEGETEHTMLLNSSVASIAAVIRQSLNVIGTHIIPACDLIERRLKNCSNKNNIVDRIFSEFRINPIILNRSLLSSPVFQVEPDAELMGGTSINVDKMAWGTWPELKAAEIRGLCKDAMGYPEIAAVFENDEEVEQAFRSITGGHYWLYCGNTQAATVQRCDISVADLNKLIILNCILYKLDAQDMPLDDVTGITLDDYRANIKLLKRYTRTQLYLMKGKIDTGSSLGITSIKDELTFKKSDDDYSSFKGVNVLCGSADVTVSEEMVEFFANSSTVSLSEVVVGMALAKVRGLVVSGNSIVERIPGYVELYNAYLQSVTGAAVNNIRNMATEELQDAIVQIAKLPCWDEYLSNLEGPGSPVNKLVSGLSKDGSYVDLLTSPAYISDLIEERRHVASSIIAVRLADLLGVPIASKILRNNIDADCSCQEKQRKALSRAIVQVVLDSLLK